MSNHSVATEPAPQTRPGLLKPNPATSPQTVPLWNADTAGDEADVFLTDAEVMAILRVKKQWLRDHTTRVEPIVPHVLIGRQVRYSRRALYDWLRSLNETRPSWERKGKDTAA